MATVYIPSLMRTLTGGEEKVEIHGSTVRQIVETLERVYPGLRDRLVDNNQVRPGISVAVDGEVSSLGMLEKVGEHSEVHFLPAIEGGSC